MKLYLFGLAIFAYSAPSFACISLPKHINVEGASFAKSMEVSLSKNCFFFLTLRSRQEIETDRANRRKMSDEFKAWDAKHPGKDYSPEQSKAFYEIEQKYPTMNTQVSITNYGKAGAGALCVSEQSKGCINSGFAAIKEGNKVVGTLEVIKGTGYVWSVNGSGKKDPKRPYLKIFPTKKDKVYQVDMIENGKPVGRIYADSSLCTKGMNMSSGDMDLRGHTFRTSPGCGNGFEEADFGSASGEKEASGGTPAE